MTNLKTTLAGWTAGLSIAGGTILDAAEKGAFSGKHGMALVLSVATILLGVFAKDKEDGTPKV